MNGSRPFESGNSGAPHFESTGPEQSKAFQQQPMGSLIGSIAGPVNVMVFCRPGNYSVEVSGTPAYENFPSQHSGEVGNGIFPTHIQRTDGMAAPSGSPTDETPRMGNWANEQRFHVRSPPPSSYTGDADDESSGVSSASMETLLVYNDMARSTQSSSTASTQSSEVGSSATEFSESD